MAFDRPPLPPIPPELIASEALVAYWPLDEGVGTYVWDVTGNGNDGVSFPEDDPAMAVSGPSWRPVGAPMTSFPNNSALFFDGIDDYLEMQPRKLPAIEGPKSLSLWVRHDYAIEPTATMTIMVLLSREKATGIRLEVRQGRLRVATYQTFDGSLDLVSVPAPAPGWHHLAYTFDGTSHALFVDGAATTTSTVTPDGPGAADRFRIGRSSSGVPDGFKGFVDDVRVYDRALTPAEVASLRAGAQ